jgi:type VI secretion system protein ImpF
MARPTANQGLMPSLLDRLIDPESEGTAWLRGYGPAQMLEAVRRDLEDLFNSHQPAVEHAGEYPEVERSIAVYGLPDLPTLYVRAQDRKLELPRAVAEIVARFEPRLRDIRVTMVGLPTAGDRRVRLHIEANLNVDPSPEVAFETVVELSTGKTSIHAGGS